MDIAKIESELRHPGRFHIKLFEDIDSTNSYLFQLGKEDVPEWTVIAAEQQTAGKGRYRRRWESPPGKGLLFSLLLRPEVDVQYLNLINLYTAYTLARYLETECKKTHGLDTNVSLKWPNDLWVDGQKICGILLEANFEVNRLQYVVVGIGLNVNHDIDDFSDEVKDSATSLKILTNHQWNRERLLAGYLDYFYENYYHYFPDNFQTIVKLYLQKVLFLKKPISIRIDERKIEGIFMGMTPEGYLILNVDGGNKIITTGDIFGIKEVQV